MIEGVCLTVHEPAMSHMAPLAWALNQTSGPILECGAGMYSTPLLHALCWPSRPLVTLETHPQWYAAVAGFANEYHTIRKIEAWRDEPFDGMWSVIFIDSRPRKSRVALIERLRDRADVIVLHDYGATKDRSKRGCVGPEIKSVRSFPNSAIYTAIKNNHTALMSDRFDVSGVNA